MTTNMLRVCRRIKIIVKIAKSQVSVSPKRRWYDYLHAQHYVTLKMRLTNAAPCLKKFWLAQSLRTSDKGCACCRREKQCHYCFLEMLQSHQGKLLRKQIFAYLTTLGAGYMNLIHNFKGEIKTPHDVTFVVSSQVPGHFTVIVSSVLVFWSITRGKQLPTENKASFFAVKVFAQVPKTETLKKKWLLLFSISSFKWRVKVTKSSGKSHLEEQSPSRLCHLM